MSPAEAVNGLVAYAQAGWKVTLPITITCGVVMLLPDHVLGGIAAYRGWIVVLFILSTTFLLVALVSGVVESCQRRRDREAKMLRIVESITGLDAAEREILLRFVRDGRRVMQLIHDHPAVKNLKVMGLIHMAGDTPATRLDPMLPFVISDDAWDYLQHRRREWNERSKSPE